MDFLNKYLEIVLVAVVLYLVVTNFVGFSSAVNSLGGVANQSIKTLQGR